MPGQRCRHGLMLSSLLLGLWALSGCASHGPPSRQVHGDTLPLKKKPKSRQPSLANEIIEMSTALHLRQALDLPRVYRKLAGRPYQALNVDNFDQVPNSTWFTNRNGAKPLDPALIRVGPNTSGPSPGGPWQVVGLKQAGVTPGMTIIDGEGRRFILKFDPVDYPELPSGTEAALAKLFYAAGYNVPENFITYFDPSILQPHPEATISFHTNDKRAPMAQRPMTGADLAKVIDQVRPTGKGPVRALASRFLPGIPIGPWSYEGVRGSDANDVYPHEHRREIRGLYVIASWLNHADMKEENTLDMYDPEAGIVRHYLIDFGSSAGSAGIAAGNPRRGQANSFDFKDAFLRLATLGLYVRNYERTPTHIPHPSVGYLENEIFNPGSWKGMYPVPAFENLTGRDAFWGAQIVTSFTDAQIEAAVEAGQFSDPEAAAYFSRYLRQRRDMVGQYWFNRLNPLTHFSLEDGQLRFADLAEGLGDLPPAEGYQCQVLSPDKGLLSESVLIDRQLPLQDGWLAEEYLAVSLKPKRPEVSVDPVVVFLQGNEGAWDLIGLRRAD